MYSNSFIYFSAQINKILVEWKDNDKKFIKVGASKHVLKCIKENSITITIVASFGVGKTATLRHVALQMGEEGFDLLLVTYQHRENNM